MRISFGKACVLLSCVMLGGISPVVYVAEGASVVERLVEQARKEGQLDLMVSAAQGNHGAKELTDAFKRRFGLKFSINYDTSGSESQKFNQAVAEIKAGIPPTFDLMQGEPPIVYELLSAGGTEPIENWESLLAEIAPETRRIKDKVSPPGLAGHGFTWATRVTVLLYNPKLISEQELPRTWKEMGNPKYRGAFTVPPWTTIAVMGILKYDKDEWLKIVRSWGQQKAQVLHYAAGVDRMMLGEFKFLYSNSSYYFESKARDSNAPVEMRFFEDFTPTRQVLYVMRKGARHPNAAKLFALWATGEEANRIVEKHAMLENLALETGPVTRKILDQFKKQHAEPVTWFDSPQTLEKFRWLGTEEGQKYSQAMASAHRDGK